ncbi:MAG TPA: DUF2330 domain-containing protein [Fimbriimonas sp.]|nr:DUF2330 domain-containing protein [Fimbriimonas sp.]
MQFSNGLPIIRPSQSRAFAVLAGLAATCVGWSCSGVGPAGQPVVFGDQTNIVIWDEAHHVEHFIRNANFKSGASDFGFIAPTPGKPELHEASTQAFYTLANLAPSYPSSGFGGGGLGGGGFGGGGAEVKVIQEADVSGFHATTLWSTDAHAINDWMNTHGYVSTPEVERWADRYTKKGWYLTAFKVIDKAQLAASTGTIRMSFRTNKPFNPFYVPKTNIPLGGGGTLRVYFVSVGDYDATIGGTETWQTPRWTTAIPWDTGDQLAAQVELPKWAIPNRSQVEAFVDTNFPRPAADDIYFVKRKPAVEEQPKPPYARPIPVYRPLAFAPLLAGFGILGVAVRRRRTF